MGISWKRTEYGMPSHDFVAEMEGRTVGRIYRHHDKWHWQWFRYLKDGTGECGVSSNRATAVLEIEAPFRQ